MTRTGLPRLIWAMGMSAGWMIGLALIIVFTVGAVRMTAFHLDVPPDAILVVGALLSVFAASTYIYYRHVHE